LNDGPWNPIVSAERKPGGETTMIRTTMRAGTLAAAPQPVILRIVRCDGPVVIPRRHSQRPAWSLLYAIAFLALVALLAIDVLLPEGLAPDRGAAGSRRVGGERRGRS
jgi:hypothetical protein